MNENLNVEKFLEEQADSCPNCEGDNVSFEYRDEQFTYGANEDAVELTAHVLVQKCDDCELEFTGDDADMIRHEAVCRHLGVLTPSEIVDIRKEYGLSRSEFAAITRLGEASLSRWEPGNGIQSAALDDYLYLLQQPQNFERIRKRRAQTGAQLTKVSNTLNVAWRGEFRVLTITETRREEAQRFVL